jgi:hypothetical protein
MRSPTRAESRMMRPSTRKAPLPLGGPRKGFTAGFMAGRVGPGQSSPAASRERQSSDRRARRTARVTVSVSGRSADRRIIRAQDRGSPSWGARSAKRTPDSRSRPGATLCAGGRQSSNRPEPRAACECDARGGFRSPDIQDNWRNLPGIRPGAKRANTAAMTSAPKILPATKKLFRSASRLGGWFQRPAPHDKPAPHAAPRAPQDAEPNRK